MVRMGSRGNGKYDDPIRERLLTAVREYEITYDTLHKVTGIDADWLKEYIEQNNRLWYSLSNEAQVRLAETAGLLVDGMQVVSADDRIKGIIDVLVKTFGITYETLSLYAGIKEQDIGAFMQDSTVLDYERKYKLATVSMFLHYIFKPNEIKST